MKIKYKLFLISFALFLFSCGKISHEKFDSNKWKTSNLNDEENISLRWDMMNELRNNYQVIGKSKTEIINLLGKPDSEINNEISYFLGYSRRGINTGNLTLTFDKNNKVQKIKVWQG